MKILSFDPGARNMGWAVLEQDKGSMIYHGSGVKHLPQWEDEKYQEYKLRVIAAYSDWGANLIRTWEPDEVVAEIIPPRGFERSVQNQLAQAAITAIFSMIYVQFGYMTVAQISATTVKKQIGGSGKASKVKVRNGVLKTFPELRSRIKDWTKKFDEPDAIAIGLAYKGIEVK